MTKKLDSKFWAKYFKVYDVLNMVIPYQELLDTIVKEAKIKKGDLVLDAGCGTGNLSMKCKKAGAKVIGIDYCVEALDRYKEKDSKAEVLVHDLTKPLPFPNNHFDKVVCNNVIYSLDKKIRPNIMKEFHRVLKPKGIVVISNVHKDFKPFLVYKDTVKRQIKRSGLSKTIILVSKMIIPTTKMLIFNKMITNANKSGQYNFITKQEQTKIMKDTGFSEISKNIVVYSEQALLVSGRK